MDLTQIVVVFCLLTLTGVTVVVAIHLINILKKIEISLDKVNQVTSDIEQMTTALKTPVNSFSEFLMGFKNGVVIFNNLLPQLKKLISKKVR